MRPLYQVHYPKIGKVTIRIEDKIMKYNHNDIVEEQAFFARYPHIFMARPDLDEAKVNVNAPKEKEVQKEEEFVPVQFKQETDPGVKAVEPEVEEPVEEEIPIPIPTPMTKMIKKEPKLEIVKAGKGWYRVVDENDTQYFPIDPNKKCRKKAAQKFLDERETNES